MKHHHDFQAERHIANHCDKLMARIAPRFDRAGASQSLLERLSGDLSERLRVQLIGPRPIVSAEPGTSLTGDALMRSIGPKAANYHVKPTQKCPGLLVSFSLDDAVRITDRLFGGAGAELEHKPSNLALSSALALEGVASTIAASFSKATGQSGHSAMVTHDVDVAHLAPFARTEYCFSWNISVAQEGLGQWGMTLALVESELDTLLRAQTTQGDRSKTPPNSSAAFDQIPLPVSAIIAQAKMPLDGVAKLQKGDLLPIALERIVPLTIDGNRLGEGRIGTLDDRVALQLTDVYLGEVQ